MNVKFFCFPLFFLFSCAAFAENLDAEKPLLTQSDSASAQQKSLTLDYIGHVYAKQGDTQLHADRVRVTLDSQHKLKIIAAVGTQGNPAVYTTILKSKKPLYASAQEIDYNVPGHTITLKGNAFVKQNNDTYTANLIYYDTLTKTVSSPATRGQQIKMVIHPSAKK